MRPSLDSTLPLLALLLAAACSDDGLANQSSGQAASSTTDMTASEDPGTTAPDPGTTTVPGEDTAPSPSDSSTSSAESTSGSSSSGPESTSSSDSGGESTTGRPAQPCADGCVVEVLCGTQWNSELECIDACEANLIEAASFSVFCHAAWEGVSECLATLTCEEFAVWDDPMRFPYPCSDADTALAVECEGQ